MEILLIWTEGTVVRSENVSCTVHVPQIWDAKKTVRCRNGSTVKEADAISDLRGCKLENLKGTFCWPNYT